MLLSILATLLANPVVESEQSGKPNRVRLSTKWRPYLHVFEVSVKKILIIFFGNFLNV